MKALIYILGGLLVAGGVLLVVTDFPFEARFPTAGPAAIGLGTIVLLATFYLSHTKKI